MTGGRDPLRVLLPLARLKQAHDLQRLARAGAKRAETQANLAKVPAAAAFTGDGDTGAAASRRDAWCLLERTRMNAQLAQETAVWLDQVALAQHSSGRVMAITALLARHARRNRR